jgi:hypothetical protein
MATEQDVRITKGRQVFYLTCEPEYNENQREPTDDEEIANAISGKIVHQKNLSRQQLLCFLKLQLNVSICTVFKGTVLPVFPVVQYV